MGMKSQRRAFSAVEIRQAKFDLVKFIVDEMLVEGAILFVIEGVSLDDGEGGVSVPAGDSPDRPPAGESGLPGGSDDYVSIASAGDDPGDLWPNILRVEPEEFIRAAF